MAQKKMSNPTKKYRTLSFIFAALGFLITFGPLSYYFITGFAIAEVAHKFILTVGLVSSLILTVINVIGKYTMRAPFFLLLLALVIVLETIKPMIILFAISVILDECLIQPLKKHFRNKYIINKEIDKRIS